MLPVGRAIIESTFPWSKTGGGEGEEEGGAPSIKAAASAVVAREEGDGGTGQAQLSKGEASKDNPQEQPAALASEWDFHATGELPQDLAPSLQTPSPFLWTGLLTSLPCGTFPLRSY